MQRARSKPSPPTTTPHTSYAMASSHLISSASALAMFSLRLLRSSRIPAITTPRQIIMAPNIHVVGIGSVTYSLP